MKSAMLAVLFALVLVFATGGCALVGSSPSPVPHATVGSYSDCAGCHLGGAQGAPVTDHIEKANCLTCHKSGTQDQDGP